MFGKVTFRGTGGDATVSWGGRYRTAVRLRTWAVGKVPKTAHVDPSGVPHLEGHVWTLNGTLAGRPDEFVCRQSGLILSIPRKGGYWTWPIVGKLAISGDRVVASLGQPSIG